MGKLAGLKQAINKARRTTCSGLPKNYTSPPIDGDEVSVVPAIPLLNEYLEQDQEVVNNADISLQV